LKLENFKIFMLLVAGKSKKSAFQDDSRIALKKSRLVTLLAKKSQKSAATIFSYL